MAAGDTKLRLELRKILSNARRDAAIFAFLTIILTPVFVTLAVAVVFFIALSFVDLPLIDNFGFQHSFISGVNLCFIFADRQSSDPLPDGFPASGSSARTGFFPRAVELQHRRFKVLA